MTKALGVEVADDFCEDCGYQPELKRTLGSFETFAISFAFISVAVGIFTTYDNVPQNAGPVGIWLWVIAGVGQVLVALVYAQFAARIPLSGSSYQWGSRLASPKIGWGFGWLTVCYLAIGVVAADNGLASQALMPLLGMQPDEGRARWITVAVLLIQVVLVVASTRIVAAINAGAVGLELAIVIVLAVALVIAVVVTGGGHAENPMMALPKSKAALAQRMHTSGESASTIATALGVSRATVYRVLAGFVALAEASTGPTKILPPSDPVG